MFDISRYLHDLDVDYDDAELRALPCGCGPRKLVFKYRIPKPSV